MAGMSLGDATDATPRQMVAFIEAAGPTRLAIMAGWHSESFARTKRLKPLDNYLPKAAEAPPRRLSGKERAAFARAEAAAWNAKVEKRAARESRKS
jgi:hypothetical protein